MKNSNDLLLDMDGKEINFGHIVAVRYVWNSYVGVARLKGLCSEGAKRHAFFSPHSYEDSATYQIIGHMDKNHQDFKQDVFNWFMQEEGDCPVQIKVYDNMKVEV